MKWLFVVIDVVAAPFFYLFNASVAISVAYSSLVTLACFTIKALIVSLAKLAKVMCELTLSAPVVLKR